MTFSETISQAFLSARREGRALSAYPGDVPASLQAAYAVQLNSIAAWDEPMVGFKVGGIPLDWRDRYPSAWLAGPVFDSHLVQAQDGRQKDIPVFDGGFAAYEPELIFRLENLKAPRPQLDKIEDSVPYIRAVHIGAEIASSPLATLNALGPGSIISDFGNQAAVVIGPNIGLEWLDRLADIQVTTIIDKAEIGRTHVNPGETGPLGALLFLLNHLRETPYGEMPDSLWLSSGAITGVHQAEIGSSCQIIYEDIGVLDLRMTAKISTETTA